VRRLGLIVVSLALAVGIASAGPAAAEDVPPERVAGRFALGDSVMLGAKSNLRAQGFGIVDAAVSRQAYGAAALLRKRGSDLPGNVVVHLGTNGTFPLDVCRAIVRAAGPERQVYLVTVHVDRSWTAGNNRMIRGCADQFGPDRVTVVDWDAAASRNPQWLYTDGAHLRPRGAEAYARLIDEAIERTGR
jgi:hypothetical protein